MVTKPRKDTPDMQKIIITLASKGVTNTEIAEITGVTRRTILKWLANTELGETVREVRKAAIELDNKKKATLNRNAIKAARELLKKRKITETETRKDKDGNLLYTVERTKETEPNASMVQFVLRNTDPKNWHDDKNIQLQADTNADPVININLTGGEPEPTEDSGE